MDKAAYATSLLFVLFLFLFGWKLHPIELFKTAECDFYVQKAEKIRAGEIPMERYHPFLYIILSASFGEILNDTFLGAKLISSIFAGIFVLFTYFLGKICFDEKIGFFALIAMVLTPRVIINGVLATSDMTFSAFAIIVLFFSVKVSIDPKPKNIIFLAFFFALAYFTRYAAVSLLVVIVFVCLSSRSGKESAVNLGIFSVCAVIFLLPHFFINIHLFGNPLYNCNWKNLAFKLYGKGERSYFLRTPFDGLISVISYSPSNFLVSMVREFKKFFFVEMEKLIVFRPSVFGKVLVVSSLAGICNVKLFLRGKKIVLVLFFFVYIIMVSAFFFTRISRIMLPVIPLSYIFAGSFIAFLSNYLSLRVAELKRHFSIRSSWMSMITMNLRIIFSAFFILTLFWASVKTAPSFFIGNHPVEELKAALRLQNKYGTNITILGVYPFFQRHLKCKYLYISSRLLRYGDRMGKERFFKRLKRFISRKKVDFLIIGKRSILRKNRVKLLINKKFPAFFKTLFHHVDVTVYKCDSASIM